MTGHPQLATDALQRRDCTRVMDVVMVRTRIMVRVRVRVLDVYGWGRSWYCGTA